MLLNSSSSFSTSTESIASTIGSRNELPGSVFLITDDGTMLRLPIPSTSAKDPLNWSNTKRAAAFLALLFYSVVGLILVQAPSIMFGSLMKDFSPEKAKPFHLTIVLSAPTLFMGIGTFVWIPLTLVWGRRPVFLLSATIMLFSTLGAAFSRSFIQLLVAVCFQGLAEGFSTSVILLMIIDLTYIHERPVFIGACWSLVGAFSLIGLFVVSQVLQGTAQDWRAFYQVWSVFDGVALVLAYVWCPETYYIRPAVAFNGRVLAQSCEENVVMYDDWEKTPGGKILPDEPDNRLHNLMPWTWSVSGNWRAMRACYSQVLLCLLNPLVVWVALLEAVVFGSMLMIGETYSLVLTMKPYSISPEHVALVNIAGALGSFLAWPATGLFIPWIVKRLTVRNGGIRDAEQYLPAFIMPVVAGSIGIILYGAAVDERLPPALVYISYGLNSFSFASLATANTLWVTEAFPKWTAPGLVVVTGISYMASFGISFAVIPWIKLQSYSLVGVEIGLAIFVVGCFAIPVAFWGKSSRQYIHGRWAFNEEGALRPH